MYRITLKDVPTLCRRSGVGALLEPSVRLHRPQARSLILPRGYGYFDRPVWTLPFFLDNSLQVPLL